MNYIFERLHVLRQGIVSIIKRFYCEIDGIERKVQTAFKGVDWSKPACLAGY
jgi:hypothetical protein